MTSPQGSSAVQVKVLHERIVDGLCVLHLRFLSHEIEGEPLWVYAVLGFFAGQIGLPGLLHLHGGLQTASEEIVCHHARRGYAVLSFDWFGPTAERAPEITTVFPAFIPQIDVRAVEIERARISHVVRMASRGLDLLAGRSEVDADKLGIFGISWGGYMTWLVNALDARVKAAVPIFGCAMPMAPSATERAWFAAFEPEHFATKQHGPVCFLNGTNDFYGHVDAAQKLFARLKVEKRVFLSPNENHGIWIESLATAERWFDQHLKGGLEFSDGPKISVSFDREGARVQVADNDARQVVVYFSYGTAAEKPGSFWREARSEKKEFMLPLWHGVKRLQVFAMTHYTDGSALTGFPEEFEIPEMELTAPPSVVTRQLYHPADGISAWFSQWRWRRTEIVPITGRLEVRRGFQNGREFLQFLPGRSRAKSDPVFDLMLRSPACPLVDGTDTTALEVELVMPTGGRCEVTLSSSGSNDLYETGAKWNATLALEPAQGVQTVRLLRSQFSVSSGQDQPELSFAQLKQLGLRLWSDGAKPPGVGVIRLV